MKIKGIKRTFSTNNNNQYKTISSFWDEYCLKYQLEDLIGIGFNWTSSTIDYMIALKDKDIDEYNFELDIDKNVNWQTKSGQTKELEKLYNEIYKDGSLTCEIEYFYNNGLCEIKYTRDDI